MDISCLLRLFRAMHGVEELVIKIYLQKNIFSLYFTSDHQKRASENATDIRFVAKGFFSELLVKDT